MHSKIPKPEKIATGVYCLSIGKGLKQVNVYFVQTQGEWVLIDAAYPKCSAIIQAAAKSLMGNTKHPVAILLTHIHPDHSGAAPELAHHWRVPVYVHPAEMPMVAGKLIPEYANPLDRWFLMPLMKIMPRLFQPKKSEINFADVIRAIDLHTDLEILPEWQCIPTPGHTPGHLAFFRKHDGVLIAGDAVLTIDLNSFWSFIRMKHRIGAPPYISTWNWQLAKKSVAVLAALKPRVLACGHGLVIKGDNVAENLRAFSERFCS